MVVFPPSFLLLQLFRKSKKRVTRSVKLKQSVEEILGEEKLNKKIEKANKKCKLVIFPWWVKIIAYILSLVISFVCIFFIIVKGISFGDEKCQKWLTSFTVSVLTSFLLTQPLQVN